MSDLQRDGIREDIAAFGRAAVIAIWRRIDPTFNLPAELEEEPK